MAAKFIILAFALVGCQAVPIWFDGNGYIPGMIYRIGRSPNMAFGFGSGFSSNIGGISHSTSIGSSFQSGDAEAYGGGIAGASGRGAYAQGVGIANAAPSYHAYHQQQPHYNNFGSAVSSAQNFGNNYGSAVSSAQAQNGLQYGSAVSAVQNAGPRYQSAVSSAQNMRGLGYESAVSAVNNNIGHGHGLGYGSAVSSAQNGGNFQSAVSSAQNSNGLNYNSAVSAAQNVGGYSGTTSHAVQQRAGSLQHSGASSINGPGLQAAQSHAVNTGFY